MRKLFAHPNASLDSREEVLEFSLQVLMQVLAYVLRTFVTTMSIVNAIE